MREISVAAIQLAFSDDMERDIAATVAAVREASARGAQVILPPELFQGHYFCRHERDVFFERAYPMLEHPALKAMVPLAAELGVAIPVSFFEKDGPHYYNSMAMVDADGKILGVYRKSHIPDGPGYEEKFYFRPGNTGFKIWDTCFGRLGVGICWDQWYPECARAMMLMGAEVLFYPTAIGSEPQEPDLDTKDLWQRAMIGHAVSNVVPIVAANRVGVEEDQTFYGHSFITSHRGEKVAELNGEDQAVIMARFDLDLIARNRASFGFFRDRRPELYTRLTQDI